MGPKELIALGDHLFGKRGSLLSMWQDIAEQFYPERADFTVTRSLGDTFADHLSTSYPLLVRRDLGNSLGTMLRPNSLEWFHMRSPREEDEDRASMAWLERASGIMRRAMDDRSSKFDKASKLGDHDIAAFGQCVKSVELNREGNGLLYRCWHLRDTAWCENAEDDIDQVHRKWKPTCAQLCELFKAKGPGRAGVHSKVAEKLVGSNKNPYHEVNCRHIVLPAWMYDGDYVGKKEGPGRGPPFVSIYLDVDNQHIMEAVGQTYFMYVIPRWQPLGGSTYACSPATIAALPDGRLLQAMTFTLQEAAEKATNPPMLAVQESLRGDLAVYAGGITYVDAAYDDRTGKVVEPLAPDLRGLPIGIEMRNDVMAMLREAFYLDKLSLPVTGPAMTATEVTMRVQDYIRQAEPIFAPLEKEDNAAICERTFELMYRTGAFGSEDDLPPGIDLKDGDIPHISFKFESPLHEAIERRKGSTFMEVVGMITQAVPLDPTAIKRLNFGTALRDALRGIGMPAAWERDEKEVQQAIDEDKAREQAAQTVEDVNAAATAAQQVGLADQALGPEALAA